MADNIPNFYRGDTKKYRLIVQDKDTGDPISVDNGTLVCSMKKKEKDTDYLLQETVNAVEADPLNPTGIIQITLSDAKTTLLPTGLIYYDFEFTSSTGDVTTILAGSVTILTDITRPAV